MVLMVNNSDEMHTGIVKTTRQTTLVSTHAHGELSRTRSVDEQCQSSRSHCVCVWGCVCVCVTRESLGGVGTLSEPTRGCEHGVSVTVVVMSGVD